MLPANTCVRCLLQSLIKKVTQAPGSQVIFLKSQQAGAAGRCASGFAPGLPYLSAHVSITALNCFQEQCSESLIFLTFVFQRKSQILRGKFSTESNDMYTMGVLLNVNLPLNSVVSLYSSFIFIPVGQIIMTCCLFKCPRTVISSHCFSPC